MSPFSLSNSKEELSHFLALSILFYFQNIFAILQFKNDEGTPQFYKATLALFFRVDTG
jgi:hypothetical protein